MKIFEKSNYIEVFFLSVKALIILKSYYDFILIKSLVVVWVILSITVLL